MWSVIILTRFSARQRPVFYLKLSIWLRAVMNCFSMYFFCVYWLNFAVLMFYHYNCMAEILSQTNPYHNVLVCFSGLWFIGFVVLLWFYSSFWFIWTSVVSSFYPLDDICLKTLSQTLDIRIMLWEQALDRTASDISILYSVSNKKHTLDSLDSHE